STNSASFSDFDKTDTSLTCPASDFTVTATFSSAVRNLKMESSEGGDVFPAAGEMVVGVDTLVNLVATPDLGYKFSHWECSSEKGTFENEKKAETNFTMPEEDCTVKAVFVKGEYKLTLAASAGGKVEGKEGVYAMGEKIFVKAIALEGYEFSRWQCEVAGVITSEEETFEISMPGEDIKVTAIFVLKTEAVPVTSQNTSDQNENSFPWGVLILVFLLSSVAIALVIIRDRYHLSYRYLIKKWFLKKDN
ncbi:MAG: hypothetical protein IKU24_04265, partial [Clostridia bacterium]|nr:hypothetical protein [Clostridia bacterium]